MSITYSAPGYIVLSGEYSALYGKPCLVVAVELQVKVRVEEADLSDPEPQLMTVREEVIQYLEKNKITFTPRNFLVHIESEIPESRGVGYEAALCVAATAALLEFFSDQKFEKDVINSIAHKAYKKLHKQALGYEVSTSCYGGLIYFRKEFEFLKTISSLNFKIPKKFEEHLQVNTSGNSKLTEEIAEMIGKNYNKDPQKYSQLFNEMEKITKRMVVAIATENLGMFRKCIYDEATLMRESNSFLTQPVLRSNNISFTHNVIGIQSHRE